MKACHTVAELRLQAKRRLPRAIFDWVDGGGGEEYSGRRNQEAFSEIRLVPRVLEPCIRRDLSTRLFGVDYAAPFGICPMGLGNLAWPGADDALVRATARAGIPYSLSTGGSTTIERVAEIAGKRAWFQLYLCEDFEITRALLRRAESAGVENVVLTIDSAHPARRLRDRKNAFGRPLLSHPAAMVDYALHPRWSLATLMAGTPRMENLETGVGDNQGSQSAHQLMASMARAKLDWESLAQVRDNWPRKLLVKGVLAPKDARRLVEAGTDGIIVSNHGGRQLGSAVATLDVLPAIRAEVGSAYPVLLDSGVRSGEDVVKALVLGANFVLLGRPFLYAVAALGPTAGAARVIEMLREELDNAMSQLGCASIAEVTPDLLWNA